MAAAIRPHGRCGVTTLTGGRVRPFRRCCPWWRSSSRRWGGPCRWGACGPWPRPLLVTGVGREGHPVRIPGLHRPAVRAARSRAAAECRDSGSVRSCGDTRAAAGRRPDRRERGHRPRRARRRGAPPRSSSSAPGTASTATTPPTSRCSSPRRPAGPREVAESWPHEVRAQPGSPRSTSPARASSTSPCGARRGDRRRACRRRGLRPHASMAGQRINLEFVSANPTGPVHIGGTRWAAVGDALARLLEASGADVTREYYFNDAGAQIDRFAAALLAAAKGEPVPEDGYAGAYIGEIATRSSPPARRAGGRRQHSRSSGRAASAHVRRDQASLDALGNALRRVLQREGPARTRRADKAVARLREQGHVFEADGATGCAPRTSATTRTGSWSRPGAADLLRRRLRLLPGQARPRLRQARDHARRRPPGYVGRCKAMVRAAGDEPGTTWKSSSGSS